MNAESALFAELLTCAGLLFWQWWLVRAMASPVVVLVRLQAIFWFVAYVLRPLYIILIHPVPPDPIADLRLMHTNYVSDLSAVLLIVMVGLTSSSMALWILTRRRSRTDAYPSRDVRLAHSSQEWLVLGILLALGWLARILSVVGQNTLYSSLAPLATVASCVGVMFVRKGVGREQLFYVVAVVGEATWSVLFASKTPILALLTAVAIRWLRDLDPVVVRRRLPLVAVVGIGVFLAIQPLKGVYTASTVSRYSDSENPVLTGVAVSVLQRADLVKAVTDAYYYRGGPWLSSEEYVEQSVLALLPKASFVDFQQAGLRWTREVRAQTYPDQTQDVYLASGVIAEGEVEGGPVGVAAESIALVLLTVVVGRLLSRRHASLPLLLAAATFTFDSVLYERGFLGVAESAAKSIQVAALAWTILLILRSLARPGAGASGDYAISARVV